MVYYKNPIVYPSGLLREYIAKINENFTELSKVFKDYVATLLAQTDYIVTKIAEAQIQNDTAEVEALKQKYATQLQQREAIRQWNEQMEQAIKNAQSLEELNSIEIKYDSK